MPFTEIENAVAAIARGELVIVVDDADRENEGDLIMAAEAMTPETMAFMIRHTSGVICMPVEGARLDELRLPLMVADNTESQRTAFTVSVDARHGTTTGISAADRSATVHALLDAATRPEDLARPGHIFPLRYREGGVLKRAGHTEAAVDLARLAGMQPAGVLAEVVNDDGTMARMPRARGVRRRARPPAHLDRRPHPLPPSLARSWCAASPRRASPPGTATSPASCSSRCSTAPSTWRSCSGEVAGQENVLVRVHSECLTGDVFGSMRCDCGLQLDAAMELIAEEGKGVVVYLRGHEGRGIGLGHKIRAYTLQDQGRDTVEANVELGFPADSREYGIGSQMLVDLGVSTMRIMTNNPAKYGGLEGYGLEIVERVPLHVLPNSENIRYLRTKQEKMGHLLEIERRGSRHQLGTTTRHGYSTRSTKARSTPRGCASRSSRGASTTTSPRRCSTARAPR